MGSGVNARTLSRIEVMVLLAISVVGHTALAVKLTRPSSAVSRAAAQTVSIEVEPPPLEPAKIPPPPRPQMRPAPAVRKVAARPHFDPPAAVEQPPVTDTPQEAPPALAPPPVQSGPPGPDPGPVAPAPVIAKPAPIIAAREGANYLKNPRPPYPEVAMRHDWEGEVLLRVRVSADGRAEGITVERTSGHEELDQAAIEAVRGWSFVPSRQGGVAISGWVSVPIVFHLQQGE
jgi:periplasmic protein TonB